MIRRLLPLGLVLLLLMPLVSTAATAQSNSSNGTAISITLNSQYIVNGFGAVVVNDTLTYLNNGTSSLQIPTVQLGIPDTVASHAIGFVLSTKGQYSQSSADNGSVTTFTITPGSPTLAAGSSSSVSLKSYISSALNITAGASGNLTARALISPSLNINVTTLDMEIQAPGGAAIKPVPTKPYEFIYAPTPTFSLYAATVSNVRPSILVQNETISETSQTSWQPVQVYSVIRTLIPTTNGVPQVEDRVSLRNLAPYSITDLPLTLLARGITNVTVVPPSTPPTINPTTVRLTNGELDIANPPFSSQIQAGDNFTFAVVYNVPKSDISTSGNTVSVTIPYILPVQTVVQNYTLATSLPSGMHADGPAKVFVANATEIEAGTTDLKYTISPGWSAEQAVPLASLLFAAAFIVLTYRRTQTVSEEEEEEEGEELSERLAELIKALEEKISLFQQFQIDTAKKPQGAVTRADFSKIRNELDSLKMRATNRLSAVRQATESQRYLDLLNQLQEAEREEDRAAKDLLNLYDQYHSRRMREETFKRLLPSYRRRLDSATNHLSDLLNLAQREGKQA